MKKSLVYKTYSFSLTERWPQLMDDVKTWYKTQEEQEGRVSDVPMQRQAFTTEQVETFLNRANLEDQALLVKLVCVVCAVCSSKEITKMKSLKYGGKQITLRCVFEQEIFYEG